MLQVLKWIMWKTNCLQNLYSIIPILKEPVDVENHLVYKIFESDLQLAILT